MLQLVCDNGIAEIEGKMEKKKLWQLICGNGIAEIGRKKKLLLLVCGNGIAEIEGKKNCGNSIAKIERKKKIVAIDLPKIGGERESCLNKKKIVHILLSFNSVFLLKQFGLYVCHVLSFCIVKVPYETNNDRFKYIEYIDSYSKNKKST